jgi:hypothetical protein
MTDAAAAFECFVGRQGILGSRCPRLFLHSRKGVRFPGLLAHATRDIFDSSVTISRLVPNRNKRFRSSLSFGLLGPPLVAAHHVSLLPADIGQC